MITKWDKFAKEHFYDFIEDVNDFDDFNYKLSLSEDNKTKGDIFEYFAKLYFELIPANKKQFKHFFLYTDILPNIKQQTKLPTKDKGIDGLLLDHNNLMYAVQIKFRTNQKIIPFGELATFPALTFGTNVQGMSGGVMFTNCNDVCDELKGDKYINITYDCFNKCDCDFWDNVRKYLSKRNLKRYKVMEPLPHQNNIFPIIKNHYNDNKNGRIYLPCGSGKTFIAYWSAVKVLSCDKIVIVVPSLYLLSETYNTWINESQYLDPPFSFTLIGSDINDRDKCEYKPTTDIEMIKNNLEKCDRHIVITTYQSCELLLNACTELNYLFDFGIFDEAHRTTGEVDKTFTCLLSNKYNICDKRLFMTATEKIYNYSKSKLSREEIDEQILSMDNENIYGKVIYKYSTRQAINDGQLVDYKIVAPFISTNMYDTLIEENEIVRVLSEQKNNKGEKKYEMKLILLCVIIKQAMESCGFTHLLIFSNTNEKSRKLYEILHELIDDDTLYLQCLSSNNNMTIRRCEVNEFERSVKGIISSARIFGEGVNIKTCDAVCFADNKGSTIDIVQYVGRCLRKFISKPDKIGHVIIPFLLEKEFEDNFFANDNKSYFKLRRIMKTLGDTDDVISEKFVLMDCGKQNIMKKNDDNSEHIPTSDIANTTLDLNTLAHHIISKIFDRTGERNTRIRNLIIRENERRWEKEELIDTKQKYFKFLKDHGIEDECPKTKNWVKYCLGNKLFAEVQKKYYYDTNLFTDACCKLCIRSRSEYGKNYRKDSKLPPLEYINNGFYYDSNPKFNLQLLLSTHTNESEI